MKGSLGQPPVVQGPGVLRLATSPDMAAAPTSIEPIDLSIIIVSFNARELLHQCLESLAKVDLGAPYEILVVDNGSDDGSAEMVRSQFPEVALIHNQANSGYARANNQALAVARGRYLLLLNSDTIVEGEAIRALLAFTEAHPNAAAAGPTILNLDGTLQSKGRPPSSVLLMIFGVAARVLPSKLRRGIAPNLYWNEDDVVRAGWLSGACLLLRRAAVQAIGGLCEELIFYGEDTEWCFRARRAGFEVWYFGRTAVRHLGGGSTRRLMPEALRLENYRILCSRTVGIPRAVIMSLLAVAVKGTLYLLVGLVLRDRERVAQLLIELKFETKVVRHLLSKRTQRPEP